jgi:hypothetical protein
METEPDGVDRFASPIELESAFHPNKVQWSNQRALLTILSVTFYTRE